MGPEVVEGSVGKGVAAAQAWVEFVFFGQSGSGERDGACLAVRLYNCELGLS